MLDQLYQLYAKKDEMKISESMNNHQLYSNQEVMEISEAIKHMTKNQNS